LEYLVEHLDLWPAMGCAGQAFVEERYDVRELSTGGW